MAHGPVTSANGGRRPRALHRPFPRALPRPRLRHRDPARRAGRGGSGRRRRARSHQFGLTVRVSGTLGTDHGSARAMFLLGGAVAGERVFTDWPGLAQKTSTRTATHGRRSTADVASRAYSRNSSRSQSPTSRRESSSTRGSRRRWRAWCGRTERRRPCTRTASWLDELASACQKTLVPALSRALSGGTAARFGLDRGGARAPAG